MRLRESLGGPRGEFTWDFRGIVWFAMPAAAAAVRAMWPHPVCVRWTNGVQWVLGFLGGAGAVALGIVTGCLDGGTKIRDLRWVMALLAVSLALLCVSSFLRQVHGRRTRAASALSGPRL
jgi:hypothetical protein